MTQDSLGDHENQVAEVHIWKEVFVYRYDWKLADRRGVNNLKNILGNSWKGYFGQKWEKQEQ